MRVPIELVSTLMKGVVVANLGELIYDFLFVDVKDTTVSCLVRTTLSFRYPLIKDIL